MGLNIILFETLYPVVKTPRLSQADLQAKYNNADELWVRYFQALDMGVKTMP